MKALLYKEFKLAMHPIIYVFVFLFPLMTLIPNYPLAIGFIYIMTAYPILFLGANKGQQSNDLLYSVLLPVRKRDIVKARILTVVIMQVVYVAMISALYPLAVLFNNFAASSDPNYAIPGLGLDAFVSLIAFGILGLAIADLIFFPIYYKNGKSIVMSTLFTILGFAVYIMLFTVVLPYIPGFGWYTWFLTNSGLLNQFLVLIGAILLSVGIHFLIYRISYKELDKVDF